MFEKTDASMSVLLIFDVVLSYNQLLNLKLNLFKRENLDHNIKFEIMREF